MEKAAERIQAENFCLSLDRNASSDAFNRRYASRLPPVYDARNLFNMPGAGTSNPHVVDRAVEAPAAGALVQPRVADPPHLNLTPPQHVSMPPGHYSNPPDNMVAAATRLAALPV